MIIKIGRAKRVLKSENLRPKYPISKESIGIFIVVKAPR